jgi:YHS domain-containing protein
VLAWFFLYKLRQKLGNDIGVVWQSYRAGKQYWFGSDGRVFGTDITSGSFNHLLESSSTVYIVDREGARTEAAMTFVFCSPDNKNWKEFRKLPTSSCATFRCGAMKTC